MLVKVQGGFRVAFGKRLYCCCVLQHCCGGAGSLMENGRPLSSLKSPNRAVINANCANVAKENLFIVFKPCYGMYILFTPWILNLKINVF